MEYSDLPNYENSEGSSLKVKIICLGDSAVGKSKLLERFLLKNYQPQQLSTYALTLFRHECSHEHKQVTVDFWDTAGQERFNKLHPGFYHQAHACILVFDVTRKITYKNLTNWYEELREYRPDIPCFCAANKIDDMPEMTKKAFNFAVKNEIPLHFVSAANGANVVKLFSSAIKGAVEYKRNPTDFMDSILSELEIMDAEVNEKTEKENYDEEES